MKEVGTNSAKRSGRLRQLFIDSLAGTATAAIFIAEYLSLGAGFGGKLPGYGQTALAAGTLLVLSATVLACIGATLSRAPVLAGPRAASLALLAVGVQSAAAFSPDAPRAAGMITVTLMVLVAGAVMLLGLLPRVRSWIAPAALLAGFMYATAVSMITGVAVRQIGPCLPGHGALTWSIVASCLALGVSWGPLVRRYGVPAERMALLAQLGLPAGAGMAWWAYVAWRPVQGWSNACATLGRVGLEPSQLTERWLLPAVWLQLPPAALAVAFGWGLALGLVLLIENLTTLQSVAIEPGRWRRLLGLSALSNMVSGPLGLPCSSFSTSRTAVLYNLGAGSRWAVACHAAALPLIVFFAMPWISQLPRLAVGVALILVAVQMISNDAASLWTRAYGDESTAASRGVIWLFWGVVITSALADQPLLGLALGAAILTAWRWARRKRSTTQLAHLPAP